MIGLHYCFLLSFAPLQNLVVIVGFPIPSQKSFTSGETAYNIFHTVFGLVGLVIVYLNNDSCIRVFLVGFGLDRSLPGGELRASFSGEIF